MKVALLLLTLIACFYAACTNTPAGQPTNGSTPTLIPAPSATHQPGATPTSARTPNPTINFTGPQLKYRLIDEFGIFFCDPDYYPVGGPEQEEHRAQETFPHILSDRDLFAAITDHLGLTQGAPLTDEQKLFIYREYKKLNAVYFQPEDDNFAFEIRTGSEPEGLQISGTISQQGQIKIQTQEAAFLTCPICLSHGTLIDTPTGQVPVEELKEGMAVWTMTKSGNRIAEPIAKLGSVPAPIGHQMVRMVLSDGRQLMASPGHPLADSRSLDEIAIRDLVDGGQVTIAERQPYQGNTFDLLPSGATGLYWANGILLSSTLSKLDAK
jgi:hypothetical protein